MRETSFTFADGFKGGLRRLKTNPANSQAFTEAYNVRVGQFGLEDYSEIAQPLVSPPTLVWPYPQLFNTSQGLMVASRTNLYGVDGSYALSSLLSFTSRSQRWTLADFGDYMVWANGGAPVERYTISTLGVWSNAWRVSSATYKVNSVCNYNGKLVAGGFNTALNTVAWSRAGRADILNLLDLTAADKTITTGKKIMEWDGEVYQVLKLGKAVVAYGSGGVSVLPAVAEPIGTFGYKEINRVGLAGMYCVAGDDDQHLWIDKAGFVWLMKADHQAKLLGYQEFIAPMLDNTIVVSFDNQNQDWYISDGSTTYLCNERGMTSIYQHPTSVIPYGGGLIGIALESEKKYAELATDRFDMQNRDIKTISVVEADVSTQNVFAAIDYKFAVNDEWKTSRFKQFNKHGFVTPMMSGVEMRYRFRWTSYDEFAMSYFISRYKQTDKRSIRGTYPLPKVAAQ